MDSPDSGEWWDVLDVSVGGLASASSASASVNDAVGGAPPTATAVAPPGFSPAAVAAEQSGAGGAGGVGGGDSSSGVQEGLRSSEPSSSSSSRLTAASSSTRWNDRDGRDKDDNAGVDAAAAAGIDVGTDEGHRTAASASPMDESGAGVVGVRGGMMVNKVMEEMQESGGARAASGEGVRLDVGGSDRREGLPESTSTSTWKQEKAQSLREVRACD